jgi:hypothetical protein
MADVVYDLGGRFAASVSTEGGAGAADANARLEHDAASASWHKDRS